MLVSYTQESSGLFGFFKKKHTHMEIWNMGVSSSTLWSGALHLLTLPTLQFICERTLCLFACCNLTWPKEEWNGASSPIGGRRRYPGPFSAEVPNRDSFLKIKALREVATSRRDRSALQLISFTIHPFLCSLGSHHLTEKPAFAFS